MSRREERIAIRKNVIHPWGGNWEKGEGGKMGALKFPVFVAVVQPTWSEKDSLLLWTDE